MKPRAQPELGLGMAIGYAGAIAASEARYLREHSEPVECREYVEAIPAAEAEIAAKQQAEREKPRQVELF